MTDKKKGREDLGNDPGGWMNDWLSDGRTATPINEAYSVLEGVEQSTGDLFPMFVAVRRSKDGDGIVPTEIALSGITRDGNILLWHTEIAPPPTWRDHVAPGDLIAPETARPAALVAQDVVERVRRAPDNALRAHRYGIPAMMLLTLLMEHPVQETEIPVLPYPFNRFQQDAERVVERMNHYVLGVKSEPDPKKEVLRLAHAWPMVYRGLELPDGRLWSDKPYALFIDDERYPPRDGRPWRVARTSSDVETILFFYGPPLHVSFDHDLGDGEPTGHEIAKAMVEGDMDENQHSGYAVGLHEDFTYYVHSQNPIGKSNIEGLLDSYLRHKQGSQDG